MWPMFVSFGEWLTRSGWQRALDRRRVWGEVEDLFRTGPQALRLARRWELTLALACQVAEARVEAVMAGLPPPHPISRAQWIADPAANALFASPDELANFLRAPAAGLVQFFEASDADEAFFAVTASLEIRASFGARMQGDMLLKDEPIETLTFREHRLLEPHATQEETLLALRRAGVRYLVSAVLHHVLEETMHRQQLEETRAVLAAKHKALSLQLKSMHHLLGETGESRATLEELGRLVAELDQDLEQADVMLGHPEDMLREVEGLLRVPRRFLKVRTVRYRLTMDGEKLPLEASNEGWLLDSTEFEPVDGRPARAMFLGRAQRGDVLGKA